MIRGSQPGPHSRLGSAIALGRGDPAACRHRPRRGPLPAQRGRGGDGLLLLQLRRPVGRAAALAPGPGDLRGGHRDDRGRDLPLQPAPLPPAAGVARAPAPGCRSGRGSCPPPPPRPQPPADRRRLQHDGLDAGGHLLLAVPALGRRLRPGAGLARLRGDRVRRGPGRLDVRVPVRSTDELGELNERFNAMVEELRRAAHTRELFGRYVSRAVAEQALERGIALGGELAQATAMFVDLRGFTALTQRTSPARVVELLNEYYAIVARVIEREGGVITQFLGDGVVAVFGGPLRPLPDHARHAVRAAIALERALAQRNAAGGERLLAGIGICTGDMIAGNVGAGGRVTYTIVGDAVNQAARLQVKTRDLGASILLTESTRAALGETNGLVLRPCGAVPLKGVAAPVEVYAVEA